MLQCMLQQHVNACHAHARNNSPTVCWQNAHQLQHLSKRGSPHWVAEVEPSVRVVAPVPQPMQALVLSQKNACRGFCVTDHLAVQLCWSAGQRVQVSWKFEWWILQRPKPSQPGAIGGAWGSAEPDPYHGALAAGGAGINSADARAHRDVVKGSTSGGGGAGAAASAGLGVAVRVGGAGALGEVRVAVGDGDGASGAGGASRRCQCDVPKSCAWRAGSK
jgi:hypothetical protein